MLELDLLIFSFGQLPLALATWVPMFLSTLLVPYQALWLWARPYALGAGLGCTLLAAHAVLLCVLPVHMALHYQLPPASRCILVFEQVRPTVGHSAGASPGPYCLDCSKGPPSHSTTTSPLLQSMQAQKG